MWISVIATKDKAAAKIKRILTAVERKSGNLLCALRTDGGGGFTTAHFREYCEELGVRRELTAPYTPQ
jgi:transposase InsO family protein